MPLFKDVELKSAKMALFVTIVISIGGAVEILPLFFMKDQIPPVADLQPLTALENEGRDLYVREGCYNCHSQQIRPFRAETERYGHYSLAGESVYEHPFQWGSKRTGPDLARVGGKYPDTWHVNHMRNPRNVVPESVMPGYPWLETTKLDTSSTQQKLKTLKLLGVPYTDEQIAAAPDVVKDKTELDALIAYLQTLGTAVK